MRTIRHSLAWKEWHEHKWKLAAITAVLWSVMALIMVWGLWDSAVLGGTQAALIICIIPMAVFVGTFSAAGEQSHRTLPFLQALPVPLWHVALYKLIFGLMTVVLPVFLTVALIAIYSLVLPLFGIDGREAMRLLLPADVHFLTNDRLVDTAYLVSLGAASLYMWTAACGANRKDEVSAGALALLSILAWWLMLLVLWGLLLEQSTGTETARLRAVGVGSAPAGLLALREFNGEGLQYALFGLAAAALTHGLLAAWYVKRFGRTADAEIHSPRQAPAQNELMEWLAPPRRRPITALVWKQFRETAPIAAAGLAGIVSTVLIVIVLSFLEGSQSPSPLGTLAQMFVSISIPFGFGIAVVAGIGVFHSDMQPGVNSFWRSRPINADLWFWTKFLVALAITLAVIYVPAVLVCAGAEADVRNLPVIALFAAHVAIFAAALAMTCLVRHAVYAAILSLGVLYLGLVATWLAILVARRVGWMEAAPLEPIDLTQGQAALAMLINFAVCTLVGWLAVRYDWGRKSRY